MIIAAYSLLAVAGVGFLFRVLAGPSVADRIIALDGVLLIIIAGLAIDAAENRRTTFIDDIVVVGLLGFVGTAIAARFVERRGG